jgi:hypothetical protein
LPPSSVVITLLNLSFSHLLWPTPPSTPFLTNAALSVGDFIGILTVAPIAMLWARQDGGVERSTKNLMLAALIDAADRIAATPTARRLDCIEGNVPAAVGTPRPRLPCMAGRLPLQCRCSTWSSA